jgi:LysR family hydrogen peroxide-inducible transcriptional activator
LYFEPFVAYIPENHHSFQKRIEINDLNVDEILLLQDGHCFRRYPTCKSSNNENNHFQIEREVLKRS